jgi:hypothetical protein
MSIAKQSIFLFSVLLFITITIVTCSHNSSKAQQIEDQEINFASDCDTTLWQHVYNPDRLEVVDSCLTVTGVIEETKAEGDGDQHMLLRPDSKFVKYINQVNIKKKNGCLVIEAICVNEIQKKKVGTSCEGCVNNVILPVVGDHVKVTGAYVNDSHNGWMEIHPITKIELIN